jgi:hypothetical protein
MRTKAKLSFEIQRALIATAEIYGRQMSDVAASLYLADLAKFSDEEILKALARCRKECKTFPTVADVTARIDDGRPGVEEAWAMLPKSEADSVVWTQEMAEAFAACAPLLDSDLVAARMAFKETYTTTLAAARNENRPTKWTVSLGHNVSHRESVLSDAVAKKRISIEDARKLVPELGEKKQSTPLAALVSQATKSLAWEGEA